MNINRIEEYLANEGYRPSLIEDCMLKFKREGIIYIIETDNNDEEFIKIIYPNFWSINDERERALADKAAQDVTRRIKVAKVYTVQQDNTWALIELFLPDEDALWPIFDRCISVLGAATNLFGETMRK